MPPKDRAIDSGNLYLLDENGKTVGKLGGTLKFVPIQTESIGDFEPFYIPSPIDCEPLIIRGKLSFVGKYMLYKYSYNNWRRMHGLPMISRKMLRTRKNRQKRGANHD